MEIAIEKAKLSLKEGNKGFGVVIVKDNVILANAHDTEVTSNDTTAHAEMNAIKKACSIVGGYLNNSILISTHEPCPMCMTAIAWSKIPELLYGVSIEDSLGEGRNMINISSNEINSRSNAGISIRKGILREKCLKLYNLKIRDKIKLLRNTSHEHWKRFEKEILRKRMDWFNDNESQINKFTGSALEIAYQMLLMKLKINQEEISVVEKSEKKLVFHSKNFCPTLEACKILGLDTRIICKEIFEESTNKFIKLVNPKLEFVRNYNLIRPFAEYCEEAIICRD